MLIPGSAGVPPAFDAGKMPALPGRDTKPLSDCRNLLSERHWGKTRPYIFLGLVLRLNNSGAQEVLQIDQTDRTIHAVED